MDVPQKSKQLVSKKEEGNLAFKAGQYQQAYELYSEGLSIDEYNKVTNAKLHCNRALVESKVFIPYLLHIKFYLDFRWVCLKMR